MTKPNFPSIPRVSNSKDIDAITRTLEIGTGVSGDGRNRFVRYSDLADVGAAQLNRLQQGNRTVFQLQPPSQLNAETPTRPTNFTAVGGFTHIILQWDFPVYVGHAHTEVWRSSTNDFGSATRIQTEIGAITSDTVDYGSEFYYWVRYVNVNDVKGPINDTAGTYAESAPNISQVITDLSDELNETHLAQTLRSRIDLIDSPVTGLVDRAVVLEGQAATLEAQASTLAAGLAGEVSDRQLDVSNLQGQINTLVIDTDVQILYQDEAPIGPFADGSRWFDTNDNNHAYVWSGGVWLDARDLLIDAVQSDLSLETINRIGADDAQIARLDSLELTVNDPTSGVVSNASAVSLLDARVITTEDSISVNASDISGLESTVFDPLNGVGAHTNAISGLDSRLTLTEGNVSTSATDISALEVTVNHPATGVVANASGLSSLDARVEVAEDSILVHSSDISALESTVNDPASGVIANSSGVNGLSTRVTAAENSIVSNASDITQLQIDLSNLDVDGNASAINALDARITTNEDSIVANSSDITTLESTVNNPLTGVGANASGISALEVRVLTTENDITANADDIAALELTVNDPASGVVANSSGLSSLDARVAINEDDISTSASDISALEVTVNNPSTGVFANSNAISGLDSRVTLTEGNIVANANDITDLQLTVNDPSDGVVANSSAIGSLSTRITTAEENITSNALSVTSLEATVNHPSAGVAANSAAITTIDVRVSLTEDEVSSQAISISQLSTTVGGQTAAISTHQQSIDGLSAQWDVKTQVGELVGGIGLYNDGSTTQFMVNADVFALLDNDGQDVNPFFITGGEVYMDTAVIQDGSIQIGKIEQLTVDDITGFSSSFVLQTIGTGNVTNQYIANVIQSNNWSPGTSGWRIDKSGLIEAHSLVLYDGPNVILSAGTGMEWSYVNGSGRPQDNATVGASWGSNISGQPSNSSLLNSQQQWSQVGGSGRPQDNATVGASWGSNISGQPSNSSLLNSQQQWSQVSGSGRPQDNATNGASWGSNISGQPSNSSILNSLQQWFEVGGSNRPDDNADVTGERLTETFSDEFVLDRDFELPGTDYWSNGTKSTAQFRSGTQSLASLNLNLNSAFVYRQTEKSTSNDLLVPIEPGGRLYISGWFYSSLSNSYGSIRLRTYNSARSVVGLTAIANAQSGNANQWQQLSGTFTAASNVFFVCIELSGINTQQSSANIYVDQLSMRKTEPGATFGSEWSQVTGSGRPDDNADVTGGNPQHASWLTNNVVGDHNRISSSNITTYMSGAAIGNAQIGNAAIGTLTIANGAVSAIEVTNDTSGYTVSKPTSTNSYGSYATPLGRSITVSNATSNTFVLANFSVHYSYDISFTDSAGFRDVVQIHLELLRNGSVRRSFRLVDFAEVNRSSIDQSDIVTIPYAESVGNGTYTYTLRMRVFGEPFPQFYSSNVIINSSQISVQLANR